MKSFWSATIAMLVAAAIAQPVMACTSNAECDDNDVCNGVETCQGGACVPGVQLVCDDTNPCTTNICDSSVGCAFLPSVGCMVSGRKLKMGTRGELRLTLLAEPEIAGTAFPANFTSADPVLNGATLRLFTETGDMFDETYSMPKSNWAYVQAPGDNAGYKYRDTASNHGPIKFAYIRNGRPSKVKGGGPALNFSLGIDPNPVNAVLQTGDQQFCISFGGIAKFRPATIFKAKKSAPPSACPFP